MPTLMSTEMSNQPHAAHATLDALLPQRAAINKVAAGRRRVLFSARGSSDHAAVYGRYLLEMWSGRPSSLAATSVATHYRARLDLSDTLVVSISQSGASEDVVATQEWAAACGAATLAIANEPDSPLLRGADLALHTRAERERAVPATKSHVTQLAAVAVVASALAPDPHRLDRDLARVPAEIARLLETITGLDDAVALLADADVMLTSGRGLMLATALEAALKIEETCLRPVRGYSYADLRHGPIAVVGEGTAALLFASPTGPLAEPMSAVARDLRERGARTIGVGGDARFADSVDVALPGPTLPEELQALAAVVPAQRIAERLSRRLGLNPDAPRGLRKVTPTEPVAG